MMMPPEEDLPVAATVILAREADSGPEVLMIERPDRGSFARAWVFPGGRLEEADRNGAETEHGAARRAGVRETEEETGLVVLAEEMVTVSRWTPPPDSPHRRIRTWFFAVPAPDGEVVLSPDEAVSHRWVQPEAALEMHARGELMLVPPTWVTLHSLAGHGALDALLETFRVSEPPHFRTMARLQDDRPTLLWFGDHEYDLFGEPGPADGRHRLEMAGLPWVYTRSAGASSSRRR